MAVKQPNMKAADSPIVMKAGDPAARETAAQKAVEAAINETPEVASALAARGIPATYDSNNRAYVELAGTTDEIHAIGEYLTSYQPARNAFLNALVNRIGLTIVTSKLYRNPWAVFKRGYLEFGTRSRKSSSTSPAFTASTPRARRTRSPSASFPTCAPRSTV